jgi:hypothetical protein
MDIPDLHTVASHASDWRTIGGAFGAGGFAAWRYGSATVHWIGRSVGKLRGAAATRVDDKPAADVPRDRVPKDALRFVQTEEQSFWGPAGSGNEQGTQLHGHWHVTNVTKPSEQLGENWNFVLLRVRIEGHEHRHARIATSGFRERVYQQFTPIPAGKMAQADADLLFFPAIADGTEPLLVDVIFTDNYGQEYRVPSKFRCILPRSPKP